MFSYQSGRRNDRPEIEQELHGKDDAFSFSQQSWNMDFKDATSAAQAAAESAERASMAARAAAELSSRGRINKQHSTESHKSDVNVHSDRRTTKDSTSKYTNDYNLKDSSNASVAEPHTRVLNEQNSKSEGSYLDDHDSDKRSAQTFSSRSKMAFDNDPVVHNVRREDEYSSKYLSKKDEMRAEIQMPSEKSEAQYGNHLPESFSHDEFDYYGEERTKKQSSSISSRSNSIVSGVKDKKLSSDNVLPGSNFGDDHSTGFDIYKQEDSLHSHYHDSDSGAIFDESGSDGEDLGFDMGSHHEEFYAHSPDRNSTDTGAGSLLKTSKLEERPQSEFFTKGNSFQEFSGSAEATIDNSHPDDSRSVRFDDSDGQSSEDETAMGHSLGSRRSSYAEGHWNNDQRRNISDESPQNFSSGEAPTSFSSPRVGKSQLESNDSDSERPYHHSVNEENKHDSSESRFPLVHEVNENLNSSRSHGSEMKDENFVKELNFGKLTGGFRHKVHTHPPYVRNQLENLSSSSWKGDEESSHVIPQSKAPSATQSAKTGVSEAFGNARKSSLANSHYDSDSDSSEEEFEKQLSSRARVRSSDKDVKSKPTLRGPVTYFDSETSDSEDDSAKQIAAGRSRVGAGVSRRTKAYPSSSGSISRPKGHTSSPVLEKSDSVERNPLTGLYGTETPPSQSQKKYSGHRIDFLPSNSGKVGSKISSADKNTDSHGGEKQPLNSRKTPEASDSFETQKVSSSQSSVNRDDSGKKASQVHQKQKPDASDKAESKKTENEKSMTREDSAKKASHVHSKLPDYDTLVARMQALRSSRD